jgi:hypothetical protein
MRLSVLMVAASANVATAAIAGEYGGVVTPRASVGSSPPWVLVELQGAFVDPVLFGGVPSDVGTDEMVVRFRNLRRGRDCAGWCFEMRVEEPACRDGQHDALRVGWMALESGTFTIPAADPVRYYAAGKVSVPATAVVDVEYHPFFASHVDSRHVCVITHVQTRKMDHFMTSRQVQRPGRSRAGFSITLSTSGGSAGEGQQQQPAGEVVGWLSVPTGTGSFGGHVYRADIITDLVVQQSQILDFQDSFRSTVPYVFANMASFDHHDRSSLRVYDLAPDQTTCTVYVSAQQCLPAGSPSPNSQPETVHFMALPGIIGQASISAERATVPMLQFDTDLSVTVVTLSSYQLYANGRLLGSGGGGVQTAQDTWGLRTDTIHGGDSGLLLAISATPSGAGSMDHLGITAMINGNVIASHDWTCAHGAVGTGWQTPDAHAGHWPRAEKSARHPTPAESIWAIWAAGAGNTSQVFCRQQLPVSRHTLGADVIGEEGSVVVSSEWRTVHLHHQYSNPVVVGGVPSYARREEAASVRIRNVRMGSDGCSGWCFDVRLQEPPCLNDRHGEEFLGWMVVEEGSYLTDEQLPFQAGTEVVSGTLTHPVEFNDAVFGAAEEIVLLTQLMTCNDPSFAVSTHQARDSRGFVTKLLRYGVALRQSTETVGWLAISVGSGHIGGTVYTAVNLGNEPTRDNAVFDIDFGQQFSVMPRLFLHVATFDHGAQATPQAIALQVTGPITTAGAHLLAQPICAVSGGGDSNFGRSDNGIGFLALQPMSGLITAKFSSAHDSWVHQDDLRPTIHVDEVDAANVALLFRRVDVHPGQPVVSARVRVLASRVGVVGTTLEIRAIASDNCSNVAAARAPAVVTAAVSTWSAHSGWLPGREYFLGDVSSLIMEVTQRSGWVSGNNICFIIRSNATMVALPAYSRDIARRRAPYLSITTEPCGEVDCGEQGFCVDGACTCINGYFGNSCEIPPGPAYLCGPIKQRFFPFVQNSCARHVCSERCAEVAMPLYANDRWPWGRFSTMCNLRGALLDGGVPVECSAPQATNSSDHDRVENGAVVPKQPCVWKPRSGDGSSDRGFHCAARLDETIMAAVAPRYGSKGSGFGFQACFASKSQDTCEMMAWCWWKAASQTCSPRTHSMMTVAVAALSQWDSLYDATLDPQGQLLHLADECSGHSARACEMLHNCAWLGDFTGCAVAPDTVKSLLQPPSCSDSWSQVASCRGRSNVECVAECSWSGAAEACMISPRTRVHLPVAPCAAREECMDDAWGIVDTVGLSCEDMLKMGTCSLDLQALFPLWPRGVTIGSVCQASSGLCGDHCEDLGTCTNMLQMWSAGENSGCYGTINTLATACPKTCGLCAQNSAPGTDSTGGAPSSRSHTVAADQSAVAALEASILAVNEAKTRQTHYGLGAVVLKASACAGLPLHNCTTNEPCRWDADAITCVLRGEVAMQAFLGQASSTSLGSLLLGWLDVVAQCADPSLDRASCEAKGNVDVESSAATAPPARGDDSFHLSKTATILVPIAAVSFLLAVGAFGSLVVSRRGTKKQKLALDSPPMGFPQMQAEYMQPSAARMHDSPIAGHLSHPRVPDSASLPDQGRTDTLDASAMGDWDSMLSDPAVGRHNGSVAWDQVFGDDSDAGNPSFGIPMFAGYDMRGQQSRLDSVQLDDPCSETESLGTGVGAYSQNESDSTPETDVDTGSWSSSPDESSSGYSRTAQAVYRRPTGPDFGTTVCLSPSVDCHASVVHPPLPAVPAFRGHPGPAAAHYGLAVPARPQRETATLDFPRFSQPPSVKSLSSDFVAGLPVSRGPIPTANHSGPRQPPPVAAPPPPPPPPPPALDDRGAKPKPPPLPPKPSGSGAARKRKLTEEKKEAVTSTVFLLCHARAITPMQAVSADVLRERYDIVQEADGASNSGALLRYGKDAARTKLLLEMALNDVFRALHWDMAQPADSPVKWNTVRRDVMWTYRKRDGDNSVYLFNMAPRALQEAAAAIEARLPVPLEELLQHTLLRVESLGAELKAAAAAQMPAGGSEQQIYRCEVPGCEYSSTERRYFLGHMRVHRGVKPFKCQVCIADACDVCAVPPLARLSLPACLLPLKIPTWQCACPSLLTLFIVPFVRQEPGCKYASYSSQHVTRHARIHTGERPYKCPWKDCGYGEAAILVQPVWCYSRQPCKSLTGHRPTLAAAAQKAHLQSHMLKHTGERPFKCTFPGCEFACTRSWHLDRHMRKHARGNGGGGGEDGGGEDGEWGESGRLATPPPDRDEVAAVWEPPMGTGEWISEPRGLSTADQQLCVGGGGDDGSVFDGIGATDTGTPPARAQFAPPPKPFDME